MKVKSILSGEYMTLWIDDDFDGYIEFDGASHYDVFTGDGELVAVFCPHDLENEVRLGSEYNSSEQKKIEEESN